MEHMNWGLQMTVLGMGLVFALLALLWLLLTIVLKLDKEDEPEEEISPQEATVEAERIAAIKRAYRTLYVGGATLTDARAKLAEQARDSSDVADMLAFIERGERALAR